MQIRQLTIPNITLFTLTQTFRYLNCCCNFFLYSATSSLFRRELREIFHCSNSLIHNQKETSTLQTAPITRTRTPSSPPLYSTNIDNTIAERKKLLVTTSQSNIDTKTVENINLALASSEPTNGHVVSFKI
jgi:hypothetical protein